MTKDRRYHMKVTMSPLIILSLDKNLTLHDLFKSFENKNCSENTVEIEVNDRRDTYILI